MPPWCDVPFGAGAGDWSKESSSGTDGGTDACVAGVSVVFSRVDNGVAGGWLVEGAVVEAALEDLRVDARPKAGLSAVVDCTKPRISDSVLISITIANVSLAML